MPDTIAMLNFGKPELGAGSDESEFELIVCGCLCVSQPSSTKLLGRRHSGEPLRRTWHNCEGTLGTLQCAAGTGAVPCV